MQPFIFINCPMKQQFVYTFAILATISFVSVSAKEISAENADLQKIAIRLEQTTAAHVQVNYEVTLPSAAVPVCYIVDADYSPIDNDTLSICNYIIEWKMSRKQGDLTGFSAYFDGHHYRYRNSKLQEFHFTADPIPFRNAAVQKNAQFIDLLPPVFAQHIQQISQDSTYQYTVKTTGKTTTIEGVRRIKGFDAMKFSYKLDTGTCLPRETDIDYNPSSISEQNVHATFSYKESPQPLTFDENELYSRFPDEFLKFRTDNFQVDNMIGQLLPAFTALTPTRQRYAHDVSDGFVAPTVIVFLSPDISSTQSTIDAIRKAADNSPRQFNIIYAFNTRDAENAENALVFSLKVNETALTHVENLIRKCGVTDFPTLLFCNTDGKIQDLQKSFNQNLDSIVIQKSLQCN